jgi:hypothetical protein
MTLTTCPCRARRTTKTRGWSGAFFLAARVLAAAQDEWQMVKARRTAGRVGDADGAARRVKPRAVRERGACELQFVALSGRSRAPVV